MRISDAIAQLQSILESRGNLEIIYEDDGMPLIVDSFTVHDPSDTQGSEYYLPERVEVFGIAIAWNKFRDWRE